MLGQLKHINFKLQMRIRTGRNSSWDRSPQEEKSRMTGERAGKRQVQNFGEHRIRKHLPAVRSLEFLPSLSSCSSTAEVLFGNVQEAKRRALEMQARDLQ